MRDNRLMPFAASVVEKNLRAAVRPAAAAVGCRQCFVHDASDGACAPPTLGAAAETAVNLTAGSRRVVARQRRTDVVVGEHVAGTHDHRSKVQASWSHTQLFYLGPAKTDFNQKSFLLIYSKLPRIGGSRNARGRPPLCLRAPSIPL